MPKSHIYNSGMRILKTLEYLHNLPEPPIGENKVQVRIQDVADYLTKECAEDTEEITRETAKNILNTIADSDTGYLLECTKSKGGQDQYWYRRPFTIEQISLLSSIISSSMFLSEKQISALLGQLSSLTSRKNAPSLSAPDHFLRPRMMNGEALDNLRIIHEAINNRQALRFYIGLFDTDKHIFYDKPLRGKASEFERIILQATPDGKVICSKQFLKKPFPEYGKPIICYPYSLAWDNSRCYLICGIEKDDHICLWNYRVDRMFELKKWSRIGYREPKSSPYYKFDTKSIDAERYLHSVFKMFTNNDPLAKVTLQFKKKLTRVIVEKFGFDVSIDSIDDVYAKVNVEVQISQQFYGWLSGFKPTDLKLVAPETEVNNYIDHLKSAIDQYKIKE